MGKVIKIIIGAALAFVVTVGLFVIMFTLIKSANHKIDESEATKIADFSMPDVDIDVNVDAAKPDKPEDPEEPPPELDTPIINDIQVDTALNMNFSPKVSVKIGAGGMSASDGEYLPIVKVAPIYPNRANSRGIEGYCIVEYTVTTTGATKDATAVDCQPSGYFERASVRAAGKFKYKPRVSDGVPIEVAGVQNKFTYELQK
jgi:protein TonB